MYFILKPTSAVDLRVETEVGDEERTLISRRIHFQTRKMADEVVEEYSSSLADLTFNSKPLINMLTMLADDHVQYAAEIVQVIEAHIQKVLSFTFFILQSSQTSVIF